MDGGNLQQVLVTNDETSSEIGVTNGNDSGLDIELQMPQNMVRDDS